MNQPLPAVPQQCSHCDVKPLCYAKRNIKNVELVLSKRQHELNKHTRLCSKGDAFRSFYVLQKGLIKSFYTEKKGKEHIVHFYLPGEIIGFEALFNQQYPYSLEVLTSAQVCEISAEKLFERLAKYPTLLQQLLALASKHIHQGFHLNYSTAEQKLVGFLLMIKDRLGLQQQADFVLPMTQENIAHHLNLAPETITRLLAKLQARGVIRISNKYVEIQDYELLGESLG